MIEKLTGQRKFQFPMKKIVGHIYTLFVVMLLWVIFRADSVSMAVSYIRTMFGGNSVENAYAIGVTGLYFRNMIGYGLIAVIGCAPWNKLIERIKSKMSMYRFDMINTVWILAVFVIACCMTLDGDYNPFVYFNF